MLAALAAAAALIEDIRESDLGITSKAALVKTFCPIPPKVLERDVYTVKIDRLSNEPGDWRVVKDF